MTEIIIEITLVALIMLVLWDYLRSYKKVETFKIKKNIYGISSTINKENEDLHTIEDNYAPINVYNEVKTWESNSCGYNHDKLRRAAEEAMRIKEQNRCEMSGNKKRVKIDGADNGLKVVLDLIDLFT